MEWTLRIYLLLGLVAHKALWELLKRKPVSPPPPAPTSLAVTFVKAVKIAILLGIAAQTLLPEILPISPEPDSLRLIGAALYTAGLVIAIFGRLQLGNNWLDIETAGVLRHQAVVDHGLYRYIRHPIYTGDLLLLTGLELALNSWLVLGVILLAPVVFKKAVGEEQMLAQSLPGYGEYCRRTKRFVPFLV
jgi:protein-S-isoprenylcysteine O-methyltransferase Ste14